MRVRQAYVDLAVQLSVQPPEDGGEQHEAADNQSAGDEDVAQQQLGDHPRLQHAGNGHLAVFSVTSRFALISESGLCSQTGHFSEKIKLK